MRRLVLRASVAKVKVGHKDIIMSKQIFEVAVDVTFDEEDIKISLESQITSELSRLHDVEVVDRDGVAEADYEIRFTGFPIEYEDGTSDIVYSAVFLREFRYLERLKPWMTDDEIADFMNSLSLDETVLYCNPILGGGIFNKDGLQDECKELVAVFDVQMLAPARKGQERIVIR